MNPPETLQFVGDFSTNIYTRSVGYIFKWNSQIVLTGLTCQLVIVDPNSLRKIVAATVSVDGESASYTTDFNTFPIPGTYQVQLQIQVAAGPPQQTTDSAIETVTVLQAL